jgi:hypothetical protein
MAEDKSILFAGYNKFNGAGKIWKLMAKKSAEKFVIIPSFLILFTSMRGWPYDLLMHRK